MVKSKLFIAKEYHIQPSEIMNMVFFEFEYMIEDIKENQKERESQQEAEDKQQHQLMRQMRSNDMMKNASSMMPNISAPKMPSFSMPSFK